MAIITEKEGDIFDAPANSVLLRTSTFILEEVTMSEIFLDACNAQGAWGKGVALEFKKKVHRSSTQERWFGCLGCTAPNPT